MDIVKTLKEGECKRHICVLLSMSLSGGPENFGHVLAISFGKECLITYDNIKTKSANFYWL